MSAWRYRPAPWTDERATLPCMACGQAPGMVAVWEGLVWRQTLCAACARLHQEGHALQLELFGEEGGDRHGDTETRGRGEGCEEEAERGDESPV